MEPTVDPVSQNLVPPGAMAEEVRDDVDIKASKGEYIVPANVVRFLGLDKIEKMVNKAKEELAKLEEQGRIGGETEEDLPFSPEELQVIEDQQAAQAPAENVPQMAAGGLVTPPNPTEIDPKTGLPRWMSTPSQNTIPQYEDSGKDKDTSKPIGLAGAIKDWTPKEFEKYSVARNDPGQQVGQMMASMIPFGGIAAKFRQRELERNVPKELAKMLETRTDLQGNKLSPEQLVGLKTSYDRMTSEPLTGFGKMGLAKGLAEKTGLIEKRKPDSKMATRQKEAVEKDSIVNRVIDAVSQTGRSKEQREKDKKDKDEKNDKDDKASSSSKSTKK